MSDSTENANLKRIRDNQRRSRARRKEYVQELEQRLRICETQGIEASAEIQQAARKVVDENKKLRSLLNRQGVQDDYIDGFLRSGAMAHSSAAGPSGGRAASAGDAGAQALEQLLLPRRPVFIDPYADPNDPSHLTSESTSPRSSIGNIGSSQHEDAMLAHSDHRRPSSSLAEYGAVVGRPLMSAEPAESLSHRSYTSASSMSSLYTSPHHSSQAYYDTSMQYMPGTYSGYETGYRGYGHDDSAHMGSLHSGSLSHQYGLSEGYAGEEGDDDIGSDRGMDMG